MFIRVCLKCYDGASGPIRSINRKDGDGPNDEEFGIETCSKCNDPMHYVYTRNELGIANGDYEHISDSLAINPCQTKAHRKLFPGIDVLPDGRLSFDSAKKQSDYCKKTGFEKMPQKIKQKGVKIS